MRVLVADGSVEFRVYRMQHTRAAIDEAACATHLVLFLQLALPLQRDLQLSFQSGKLCRTINKT